MNTGKITSIVVVDVVGYSAMAEADEAAAIAAVARLGEHCAQVAGQHGGRIFNTSGDAVMMEFASAFAAVRASLDLAASSDPPVRVAVHTGEVAPMPTGDLLGRGVSIAARLQGYGRPGIVIVSDETRKLLRGPLVDKLVSKGPVKLDRMDESIAVFELAPDDAKPQRAFTRKQKIWLAAGVLAAIAALIVIALPFFNREPRLRVAVLTLAAEGAELQGVAEGVAEDADMALRARGFETVPRDRARGEERNQQLAHARTAGAPLALEGAVERSDGIVRISVAVARTSDSETLWSDITEGPREAAPALRQRASARAVNALSCALRADRTAPTDAYSPLLNACAHVEDRDFVSQDRDALAQVLARAPDLALAHALFALRTAALLETASEPQQGQLRAEIRTSAERALRSDRTIGEAYLALERIEPRRRWDARERILQQGVDRDERNSTLSAEYSRLLFEVGRYDEALAFARNSSTLEPLSLDRRTSVGSILLQSGDIESARDIADELSEISPEDSNLWLLRLRIAFWGETYDDASALINSPASQIRSTRARQCWSEAIAAMRSAAETPARAAAIRRVVDCSNTGDLPTAQTLMQFSALGELDEAFALARRRFEDERRGGEDVLFSAATRPMRTDPRFMPLMRDIGLLAYWRLSGHWPDFCRDPGLPYRCQDEAQRLL